MFWNNLMAGQEYMDFTVAGINEIASSFCTINFFVYIRSKNSDIWFIWGTWRSWTCRIRPRSFPSNAFEYLQIQQRIISLDPYMLLQIQKQHFAPLNEIFQRSTIMAKFWVESMARRESFLFSLIWIFLFSRFLPMRFILRGQHREPYIAGTQCTCKA